MDAIMPKDTIALSIEKEKSQTRFFGIASAILLGIIIFIPFKIAKALSLIGFAVTGWRFIFHGSTAVSLALEGVARHKFQIFISVALPTLLSLYFIKDTAVVTVEGLLGHMRSIWFFLPIGIITYVSWTAADQLHREHPFRGFLIACAVIFVLCYMGHHGIYSEHDDYTDTSSTYIDKEAAQRARSTGRYFGQFWVYITVSYGAMLIKMHRK
jgi:phosphoglycerol transferase MdoB-like AlkP superfamily enzyme